MLAAPAQGADRALVVGINSYPNITQNGQPNASDLLGAVADAEGFARFLTSNFGFAPGDIKLLIDGDATKAAILGAFDDWLVAGTNPGDRALFYYAGHGAQILDEDGDEALKTPGDKFDEALAPADASGELSAGGAKLENLLIDDEIDTLLSKLQDRDVMVVVDSCHSGTITRSLEADSASQGRVRARTLTPRGPIRSRSVAFSDRDRAKHKISTRLIDVSADPASPIAGAAKPPIVWTATASSQLALDMDSGGLFTQSFLGGIVDGRADANRDGTISASELLDYVRRESEIACRENAAVCKSGLTPTVEAPDDYLKEVLFPFGADKEVLATLKKEAEEKKAAAGDAYAAVAGDTAKKADEYFGGKQDFALKIEMLPSARPKLGASVKFRVTSAEPGSLILLDQGPDGSFTQIFPNEFAKKEGKIGNIRGSKPLTVPDVYYGFEFEATDKGKGVLIALVAEDAAPIEGVIGGQLDLKTLDDPDKLIDELAKQLYKPLETEKDEPNRRLRWSFAKLVYEVN
jgi:hypothetical protein